MHTATPPPLLQEIHTLLGTLHDTLQQEAGALAENDMDTLAQLTVKKHRLCEQLEGLEKALQGHATLPAWRKLPLWQDITSLFAQCQRHNRRNGMVVMRKRHDVATLLATLHGQTGRERTTYGRHGGPDASPGGGGLLASA